MTIFIDGHINFYDSIDLCYLYFNIKTNTILTNCISLCTKKYEIEK